MRYLKTIEPEMAVVIGIVLGLVASLVLIITMILTGQTFGQRCAASGFKWDSPPHRECVRRLAYGSDMAGHTNNSPDNREGQE